MATRKKTIRVPTNFGNVADVNTSTNSITGSVTLGTPLIPIMENSATFPVTFTSVNLYLGAQDTSTVTGGSLSGFTATTQITGAATAATVNLVTTVLANSGENWGGLFGPINFTAHFNGSFGTLTGKTAAVKFGGGISTGTGTAIRGVYGYFEITYTYDDSASGRTMTICVPYESGTSTLTTTANTNFATIPNLTGTGGWFSGHTNPVVRHRWIELRGNCNNNNTVTNHGMSYAFDGGTGIVLPQRISALATDTFQIYQIDAFSGGTLSTAAPHNFQLWNSLATRWANIIANEWITYDYAVAGTTEAWNFLELPISYTSPAPSAATVNDMTTKVVSIQEPNPLMLMNSAIELDYSSAASATINMKVGAQSAYRAYAQTSNVVGGAFAFQHRFDSGSGSGSGVTITRGNNTIATNMFKSTGAATFLSGTIKLLYKSGVSSLGVDAHNHTTTSSTRLFNTTLFSENTVNDNVTYPETNYYIQGVGLQHHIWPLGTAALPVVTTAQARFLTGETNNGGWRYLMTDMVSSDGELAYYPWTVVADTNYKRYPNDPDLNRVFLSVARGYRTTFTSTTPYGQKWMTTYHTIYTGVSGTITGSSGGTITLDLYQISGTTPTLYDTTTRTGNGAYSFTVYDDTKSYYVVAYENSVFKNVSKRAAPNNDFNISLTSSVTTGYAGG